MGAESPGAVLAPPGTGRGVASRTLVGPEPGAPRHSRQGCQAAGEAQKHHLTSLAQLSAQNVQVSLGSVKPLSPPDHRNRTHLRADKCRGSPAPGPSFQSPLCVSARQERRGGGVGDMR